MTTVPPDAVKVSGYFRKVVVGGVTAYVRTDYPLGTLEAAVQALVDAERERCAKVVESWPEPSYEFDRGDLAAIARRIREGTP